MSGSSAIARVQSRMLPAGAIVALLAVGCEKLLMSKEQRQLAEAMEQAINDDPSRLNAPYLDGEPPLHIALLNDLPELFDRLLARGADPDATDQRGESALHHAVIVDVQNRRATRALLEHGANINLQRNDGGTALHIAALLSRAANLQLLLEAGADPNASDNLGSTPLHRAAAPQPTATPRDAALAIHRLVAGGADVCAFRNNGDTPLHIAALVGSAIASRALLKEGAEVDLPGAGGATALHVAAAFGNTEVAEILLVAGADPNRKDDTGLTPLGRALHAPAVTAGPKRTGTVDTSEVARLLRRFGAIE